MSDRFTSHGLLFPWRKRLAKQPAAVSKHAELHLMRASKDDPLVKDRSLAGRVVVSSVVDQDADGDVLYVWFTGGSRLIVGADGGRLFAVVEP